MKTQLILVSVLLNLLNTGCTTNTDSQEASIIAISTKKSMVSLEATFAQKSAPISTGIISTFFYSQLSNYL